MLSKLFGLAATLVRSRKYTLVLVGLRFAYLGYKYIKDKKGRKKTELPTKQ